MKAIFIDYAHSTISISSAFAKRAFTPGTDEYRRLMDVRKDYPEFRLVTREFKTNTKQERYRGLNYPFMREYIRTHEEDPEPVLKVLEDQIGTSKAHSLGRRYPTIKAWFLERYPAFAEFGMTADELAKQRAKQQEPAPQEAASQKDASQEAEPQETTSQKVVEMTAPDSSDTEAKEDEAAA